MKKYTQLNIYEREEISRGLSQKHSLRKISILLNRSVSTISREVKRNYSTKKYRGFIAEQRAFKLRKTPKRKLKINSNKLLQEFVIIHLHKRWSPEQIAKKLKILYPDDMSKNISHESIYKYLYIWPRGQLKKELSSLLRYQHKNRKNHKERIQSCPI